MERENSGGRRSWKSIEDKLNYWKTTLSYFDDEAIMLDNTILSLTQTGQEKWRARPHENLVGEIQSVLQTQHRLHEANGEQLDPAEWISTRFTSLIFTSNTGQKDHRPESLVNHSVLDVCRSFEAIALPHIKRDDYRDIVSGLLTSEAASRKSSVIHLKPDAVRLLDALADAVEIPHTRGDSTVDLLTNVTMCQRESIARHRRNAERNILDHHRRTGEEISVDGLCLNLSDTRPTHNTNTNYSSPRRTENALVRMRDGSLIDKEFSAKDYPHTMNVVFVGDIRFTRGADDVFRADSDDTVRAQEEDSVHAARNIFERDEYMKTLQPNNNTPIPLSENDRERTITFDGKEGLFSPTPTYRIIEGKKITVAGQDGWFYPYPPRRPVNPAFAAMFDD